MDDMVLICFDQGTGAFGLGTIENNITLTTKKYGTLFLIQSIWD